MSRTKVQMVAVAGLLLLVVAAGGCRKGGGGGPVDEVAAKQIFEQRCVACHGTSGRGDGPGSKGLKPPPRDYSDPAWQTSVTDEQIKKAVLAGGAAVGKSPLMPGNIDLKGKEAVLNGLVKIIRGFKR